MRENDKLFYESRFVRSMARNEQSTNETNGGGGRERGGIDHFRITNIIVAQLLSTCVRGFNGYVRVAVDGNDQNINAKIMVAMRVLWRPI